MAFWPYVNNDILECAIRLSCHSIKFPCYYSSTRLAIINIRELKHARFWDADDNRKWAVLTFNLPSHNYVHIAKYLSSIRDE